MKAMNFKKVILLSISALAVVFVVYKLSVFPNWDFVFQYKSLKYEFVAMIVIQLLLLLISLLFESLKWKTLVSPFVNLSVKDSLYQILKGIQGGVISPARLGDPPARVLLLPNEIRFFAIGNFFVGSFIQNLIIGAGALVAFIFVDKSVFEIVGSNLMKYFVLLLIVILVSFFIIIYFINNKRAKILKKVRLLFKNLKKFNFKDIVLVFSYSLFKYILFCLQLFLFLYFFKIIELSDIMTIALYFGMITIIPSFAIADLGIRGSVALFVFGSISPNSGAIVISIFLLWLINLAIPAMIPLFMPLSSVLQIDD